MKTTKTSAYLALPALISMFCSSCMDNMGSSGRTSGRNGNPAQLNSQGRTIDNNISSLRFECRIPEAHGSGMYGAQMEGAARNKRFTVSSPDYTLPGAPAAQVGRLMTGRMGNITGLRVQGSEPSASAFAGILPHPCESGLFSAGCS